MMTRSTKTTRTLRTGALGAAAATALTGAAGAQSFNDQEVSAPLKFRSNYFGYAASVSPRVTYTDNINLNPDPFEEGEFIASTVFNGAAIYSTKRLTAIVDGDLDFSWLTDQGEVVVNQDIAGTATATVVDNLAYVDISGSTSRQLAGENARFSSNINAARNQRRNVHSYSISPYLNRQFPNDGAAELRYRYSDVFVDDGDRTSDELRTFFNDSTTHEALATYRSGDLFDRAKFILTAYGNRTEEEGAPTDVAGEFIIPDYTYEQGSLSASGEYALSERFALVGTVGYDEVDTDAPDQFLNGEDLSGVFWRAGFRARPGRKTDVRIEYGRRYDDDFIDANLSYQISNTLRFDARAGRTFRTRAQTVTSQYRNANRRTLEFADSLRRNNEGLSPRGVVDAANLVRGGFNNAQVVGLGVSNNAYAGLGGIFGRTQVTAYANYDDTDFGYRQTETIGGGVGLRHQFSRRLTGYTDVFYRYADTSVDLATCLATPQFFGFDGTSATPVGELCAQFVAVNGKTNTVGGRIGASYRVVKNVSAFGEFSRTERFSDAPLLEYSENVVSAGLILDF